MISSNDTPQPEAPVVQGVKSRARLIAMIGDNVLAIILAMVLSSKLPVPDEAWRGFILVTAYLAYYLLPEALFGRTLMKRVCHLVVRRLDGKTAGWKESALRTLTRVVEVNPVLLGALPAAIAVVCSRRQQRLGDMLARTVVVSDK